MFSRKNKMLLVGVWVNRNWILGNWIREVQARSKINFTLRWVPFIYSGKRNIENFLVPKFSKYDAYFFSYPTIFKKYLESNFDEYAERSIILYPHCEPEMGTLEEQVSLLNNAFSIHFYCSADAYKLRDLGLKPEKIRLAFCAVDVDCVPDSSVSRKNNLVVLASRYGPRKGLEILPEIVAARPDLEFIALGRGWEEFISSTSLATASNFSYVKFNKENRNRIFSEATIFISLSNLEGGPVPLIEALDMGVTPIATRTGFAPDLIREGENGYLLPLVPTVSQVLDAIQDALSAKLKIKSSGLTWDRITSMTIQDFREIQINKALTAK
jgi:glycosyltransferase involved in cell wall biosynthesis